MNNRNAIRIAVVGVGNCASSLIQGIHYYTRERCRQGVTGLMHTQIGDYLPCDIEVVAAFDVDARKVGQDVNQAIFAKPNCTKVFHRDIPDSGVIVRMGQVLDGISEHMSEYAEDRTFVRSGAIESTKEQIVRELKRSGAEILVSYVPVGSEQAARFYAECALEAGVALINNMPVFIASDKEFAERFRARNLPIIGDDIKSQLGATIVHRVLTDLFAKRGVKVLRTYQLNTGGNTDFLNMKNQSRLVSKKTSKTEAVQAVAASRMEDSLQAPVLPRGFELPGGVFVIHHQGAVRETTRGGRVLFLAVEENPLKVRPFPCDLESAGDIHPVRLDRRVPFAGEQSTVGLNRLAHLLYTGRRKTRQPRECDRADSA